MAKPHFDNLLSEMVMHDHTLTELSDVNAGSPSDNQALTWDAATSKWVPETISGSGDVVGPASATDNAVVRFDSTTGKLIQNSGVTIDDSDNVTLTGNITIDSDSAGIVFGDEQDATLKWDNTNDIVALNEDLEIERLGIGSHDFSFEGTKLIAENDGDHSVGLFISHNSLGDNRAGGLLMGMSRGTKASPSAVVSGDRLGYFLARGYDGSAWQHPAGINYISEGTISSGNVPCKVEFLTGSNSSNRSARLTISSSGTITTTGAFNANNSTFNIGSYGSKLFGDVGVTIKKDVNAVAGVEMHNSSTGGNADFRFMVLDTAKKFYMAYAVPGSGNTASLFGLTRNATAYIFTNVASGGTARDFAIGTVDAKDLYFATNNTQRVKIASNGNAYIGDGGTTNYLEIKSDGEINLHGTARVTKDLWIDASGIKAPGSKPATEISFGALETTAWQFSDEGVAGNQQTVSWRIAPLYDMDRSVAPVIRIGWSSASSGNCEWQLEYRWLSEDEDCTAAAEETLTVIDAASTTSNGLVITTVSGINAPSSTDASIIFRLKRLSAGANDTISDTVELHGICFNYTSNKLGE